MAGLKKAGANGWREIATKRLEAMKDPDTGKSMYKVLNPVRGREWLTGQTKRGWFPKSDKKGAGWGREVVRRDRYDVARADIILCNFDVDVCISGRVNLQTRLDENEQATLDKFLAENPSIAEVIDKEATRASIGSIAECTWAREFGKFTLVVMDLNKHNVHEHVFITDFASFIVPTLDEALEYMETVLNSPY
jgi:hypothetical protein